MIKQRLPLIFLILVFLSGCQKSIDPFMLESQYYITSDLVEIEVEQLETMIGSKESFVLFIYQPMCLACRDFEILLNEYLASNTITFLKIEYSKITDSNINQKIKYYPSLLLYHQGKLVEYLEADSDDDIPIYTTIEGFDTWLKTYIEFPQE